MKKEDLFVKWWKIGGYDLTLPNSAARKSWESYVEEYLRSQTEDLCDNCKSILYKRNKLRKNIK